MRIENGKRILEPGDEIRVPDREMKRFITVQIAKIAYQDDFGEDGFDAEFYDTKGYYRSWKQRFDGGFLLNTAPVPENVKRNVLDYFDNEEHLACYTVKEVVRASEHPQDNFLYMVIAQHENGSYAVWTSWNETTHSLNFGHYGISSYKEAKTVCGEYFHKVR